MNRVNNANHKDRSICWPNPEYYRNDMSYLDRIQACNNLNTQNFRPFIINSTQVGWMRPEFVERLQQWPNVFQITPDSIRLSDALNSFEQRSEALIAVNEVLFEEGLIRRRAYAENYSISAEDRLKPLACLDRAAAPHYGIRAYGQHLNGYVRTQEGLKMWVGLRSLSKPNEPGKLDQIVAGGLPYPLTEEENLIKECDEEANISESLAKQATAVGYIAYRAEIAEGAKPDTMLCYDLELPEDFVPSCNDGEVERFELLPIEEVAERVRDTDDFKMNCSLVIIDFLIRHGYLTESDPEYTAIKDSLRNL